MVRPLPMGGAGSLWRPGLFGAAFFLLALLAGPPSAQAQAGFHDEGHLGPGEAVLYEILPKLGQVRRMAAGPREPRWHLTDLAVEAVDTAPSWLHWVLSDKLGELDDQLQDELAQVILDAWDEDPRYTDEVAFCVAHLSKEDLTFVDERSGLGFDPAILLENARLIYQADARLDYVELEETGSLEKGGDYRTTTVYQVLQDGQQVAYRLPSEQYYWWVVHPKISADHVMYVLPPTDRVASPEEGGRFWREYFWAPRGSENDFSRPFVLRVPDTISDEDLSGWSPSAMGFLTTARIDPIPEVVRGDGKAVMIRLSFHPADSAAGDNGTVIATTMPVERAAAEQGSHLLANLLSLGDGNVRIHPGWNGNRILVLQDRPPFGTNQVTETLSALGYDFDVMDSTALAALTTWEDFDAYEKIVAVSDQPRQFYERLSAARDIIDQWVGRSDKDADMVFEFHGAVSPEHLPGDDWTDLPMPGDIQGHDLADATDQVMGWGYPKIADVIAGCSSVWDGHVHEALSGDRFLTGGETALNLLGYLVSQNLDDRVGELPADWAGPDGDCPGCVLRSVNAVRVAYGHYENCGGIGILMTALGRSMLLPVAKVSGMPEDHEWNEFFLDDQWHSLQVDWSDGDTRIARPGNVQDKDFGGGKDLSMVFTWRGDGLAIDDMDRYSKTVTMSVAVVDASGLPVDGATVLVASETWYDPNSLTLATVEVTDKDGLAEFVVGDHQNFYLRVDSPAGWWPDPDHVEWVACAAPDATGTGQAPCPQTAPWGGDMPTTDEPGSQVDVDIVLDGTGIQTLPLSADENHSPLRFSLPSSDPAVGTSRLLVSGEMLAQIRALPALATATEEMDKGAGAAFVSLSAYLLDIDQVQAFLQGRPFLYRGIFDLTDPALVTGMALDLPEDSPAWYLLVANDRRVETSHVYDLSLQLESEEAGSDGGTDATGVCGGATRGCGCRSLDDATMPTAPPLLVLFGLAVLLRRRRR